MNHALGKQVIYVSGLPRAGSTFLCQVLGMHPSIHSSGHSSPLATLIENLRGTVSDQPFFLSQADVDFDAAYARLFRSIQGLMRGWLVESEKPAVVDKARSWLGIAPLLQQLDPTFRIIVCLRDPIQIMGSIEAQHQKSLLLDFPDHMPARFALQRAEELLGPVGTVGGPLLMIDALRDLPADSPIMKQIYFLPFEVVAKNPASEFKKLFQWLDLPPAKIDFENLHVAPHESDSYYRFKYLHKTRKTVKEPPPHVLPKRVEKFIVQRCAWFYKTFYPDFEHPALLEPMPTKAGSGHDGTASKGPRSMRINKSPSAT